MKKTDGTPTEFSKMTDAQRKDYLAVRGVDPCKLREIVEVAADSERIKNPALKTESGLMAYLQKHRPGHLWLAVEEAHTHLANSGQLTHSECEGPRMPRKSKQPPTQL